MTTPTRGQVNKLLEMIQRHFPSLPVSDAYTDWKKWSEFAQAAFSFGASEARADLEAELEVLRIAHRAHEDSNLQMLAKLKQQAHELESLRNVIQLAADDIRRCDYTPARSKLLIAIAAAPKEK